MVFDEREYIIQIILYSIFLFSFGITYSKYLDKLFTKDIKSKSRFQLIIEIYVQILCLVMGIYVIRKTIDLVMGNIFSPLKNPEKYALLVLGSPMFAQELNLIDKIKYIWKDI